MRGLSRTFLPLLLAASLATSGCTSSDLRDTGETLATTSAILVAIPLAPFAEGYHALSGDVKKRAEAFRAESARLDPIYEQRRQMLAARIAADDANAVARDGFIVFLPPTAGMVEENRTNPWPNFEPEFYADYEKAQAGSKLYKALCDLVFDDPSQTAFEKENGMVPFSPTYKKFLTAKWEYIDAFDKRMRQIAQEKK